MLISRAHMEPLIMGGDRNVILIKIFIDKQGPLKCTSSPYKDNILAAMKELDLIYLMRDCYPPPKKILTYESTSI